MILEDVFYTGLVGFEPQKDGFSGLNPCNRFIKECLYFGATRWSRPSKLFQCDGSRVEACTNNSRDVVVGVFRRDATSRLYFFLEKRRDGPDSRRACWQTRRDDSADVRAWSGVFLV
ncbi:hypothetical protein Y032_0312g2180 [Ancylostoma ceylanicum]|uniref:Uncharacterized protein n=1 Tax=Ancylostoma ceylanicum TaxID=53326 RepID=A0A016S353_9BILA|nr:hypothetical protein Y032_0312g2180 [Ancylostoma ceylanicum]